MCIMYIVICVRLLAGKWWVQRPTRSSINYAQKWEVFARGHPCPYARLQHTQSPVASESVQQCRGAGIVVYFILLLFRITQGNTDVVDELLCYAHLFVYTKIICPVCCEYLGKNKQSKKKKKKIEFYTINV